MKLIEFWSHVAAGVTYCGSVPATPDYCSVVLPDGQFVGGIECGNTAENQARISLKRPFSFWACWLCLTAVEPLQYVYFAQLPGQSCTDSCDCGSDEACAVLGPIGSPRFCYYYAPASCFTPGECSQLDTAHARIDIA